MTLTMTRLPQVSLSLRMYQADDESVRGQPE